MDALGTATVMVVAAGRKYEAAGWVGVDLARRACRELTPSFSIKLWETLLSTNESIR